MYARCKNSNNFARRPKIAPTVGFVVQISLYVLIIVFSSKALKKILIFFFTIFLLYLSFY
jgi:hypothetical protein